MAVCTALGLLTGLQIYLARLAESEPSYIGDALAFGAVSWLPWAAAAPLILALGRPLAFQRGCPTRSCF
jgi:hypothetical protein